MSKVKWWVWNGEEYIQTSIIGKASLPGWWMIEDGNFVHHKMLSRTRPVLLERGRIVWTVYFDSDFAGLAKIEMKRVKEFKLIKIRVFKYLLTCGGWYPSLELFLSKKDAENNLKEQMMEYIGNLRGQGDYYISRADKLEDEWS